MLKSFRLSTISGARRGSCSLGQPNARIANSTYDSTTRLRAGIADDSDQTFHPARLIEVSRGSFIVRLGDFARNGPDLFVYLSPSADGYTDGVVELGRAQCRPRQPGLRPCSDRRVVRPQRGDLVQAVRRTVRDGNPGLSLRSATETGVVTIPSSGCNRGWASLPTRVARMATRFQ
jgi:hypothetical protein